MDRMGGNGVDGRWMGWRVMGWLENEWDGR